MRNNPFIDHPFGLEFEWDDDDDVQPLPPFPEHLYLDYRLNMPNGARLVFVPDDWPRLDAYGSVAYSIEGREGPWHDIGPSNQIDVTPETDTQIVLRATPNATNHSERRGPQFDVVPVNLNGPSWHVDLATMRSIHTAVLVNQRVERAAYFLYYNGRYRGMPDTGGLNLMTQSDPDREGGIVSWNFTPNSKRAIARYIGPFGRWTTEVSTKDLMPRSWPFPAEEPTTSTESVS